MIFLRYRAYFILIITLIISSCANIVPPQGGEKDTIPPQLLSVTPADSLLNTRVNKIELRFDEFITVSDVASEVHISPLLPFPLNVEASSRKVTVKIPDSLLKENTTYRITFGKAIKDLHENNPFTAYSYIFSTGSYFDSMRMAGYVIDAATGMRDTGAQVLLYDAAKSDSIIVREKPSYVVKADGSGNFSFEGLPNRAFKIFALADANNNLVYDGAGEKVAFLRQPVQPGDSDMIKLYLFAEKDTSKNSATAPADTKNPADRMSRLNKPQAIPDGLSYVTGIDTSDNKKRTVEITQPLKVSFKTKIAAINDNRINLAYDSAGISVETPIKLSLDTSGKNMQLQTEWKENTLYTLRLLKGFAKDTGNNDLMPSRYTFRTKREEDYSKLHIHLPAQYLGDQYLFVLLKDNDSIYQKPVTDTMIHFLRLQPGTYTLRIIADKNKNGQWDAGELFAGRQPEEVVPHINPVTLKPGWENMIDFETFKAPAPGKMRFGLSPGKRDVPR